jgi:hypothetical protein
MIDLGGMRQVVEHLLCKHRAPSSNRSPTQKNHFLKIIVIKVSISVVTLDANDLNMSSHTVNIFVNVTIYSQYNNNMLIKIKKKGGKSLNSPITWHCN